MLMIEQDGQAITFPIDSQEAKGIANYLRGPSKAGRPVGGGDAITDEEVKEAAVLYQSAEADGRRNRLSHVAEAMGISKGRANSLVIRGRKSGAITKRYDTGGREISDA